MASIFRAFPHLRSAAPRLSRNIFTCDKCSRTLNRSKAAFSTRAIASPNAAPFRQKSLQGLQQLISKRSSSAPSLATLPNDIVKTKARRFPEVSEKSVAYWLLGSAASVFGIVVFGGLTRLTESGLSITEWRPVTGSLPPMSQEDWDSEFTKYRASPEFQRLNPNMALDEFKQIYWMEWGHRLWGRVIGVTFLLPTVYFVARKKVSTRMVLRLTGICGLIGFQGFLGWWMVKSGLKDDLFAPGSHPRVSQYRLTAHLGAAFLVYTAMLTSGLSILRERRFLSNPKKALETLRALKTPPLRAFRGLVAALSVLVFATAMSGALVAGLDAGLIYNEFPYMGLGLSPPMKELFDPWYSHVADHSDMWWRNMLENPSLVQLDHRIMATTTFTAIMSLFAYTRFSQLRHTIPKDAKKGMLGVVHLVSLQVALGISTLIYLVPTWLASMHQAGSLLLLSGVLVLRSRIIAPHRTLKLVKKALEQSTSTIHGSSANPARTHLRMGSVEQTRI